MKWSFATIGVIMLGLIGLSIILLFQNITTNNENDYYLLKEVTEAAMIDAIDISYYRETGDLRIVKEKFVENFTRRFAESTVFVTNNYKINFYDIIETPPKVSIIVDTGLGEYTINGNSDEYNIANKLDAILEYTGKNTYVSSASSYYNNPYTSEIIKATYYAMPKVNSDGTFSVSFSLTVPRELVAPNIRNIRVSKVSFIDNVTTQGELNESILKSALSYNNYDDMSDTYYKQIISDFNLNVSNVDTDFYNCGISTTKYKCDDINKYWVTLTGNSSAIKSKSVFKYEVTWSYEKYEYVD